MAWAGDKAGAGKAAVELRTVAAADWVRGRSPGAAGPGVSQGLLFRGGQWGEGRRGTKLDPTKEGLFFFFFFLFLCMEGGGGGQGEAGGFFSFFLNKDYSVEKRF
jgi:hypothetical protein